MSTMRPAPDAVVHHGDCREILPTLAPGAVQAVVTDPPYGIGFMGKGWDGVVPGVDYWRVVLAALPPGGHCLAFGGTRTWHRLAVALEDAGFEIRDTVCWLYGNGFPKSLDVSKAIDKAAGYYEKRGMGKAVDRTALDYGGATGKAKNGLTSEYGPQSTPATDAAREWSGWGTALKPAWEPVIVARKPLRGTIAENVLRYGTGGLNIDANRIAGPVPRHAIGGQANVGAGGVYNDGWTGGADTRVGPRHPDSERHHAAGRWPANVAHDGSGEVLARFGPDLGAARFFYCAKASARERRNAAGHVTQKPLALLRWLVRLVTPPGGTVCDPFAGSGTTGVAAVAEGFGFVGVEIEETYSRAAGLRVRLAQRQARKQGAG